MTRDDHLAMIEDCENRSEQLTEWEAGFIDSIRTRVQRDKPLSMKQAATLNNIWDRVTTK